MFPAFLYFCSICYINIPLFPSNHQNSLQSLPNGLKGFKNGLKVIEGQYYHMLGIIKSGAECAAPGNHSAWH